MKMENLITWLEKQIEGCDAFHGMEKEKWAFIQVLKKVRKEQNKSSEKPPEYCNKHKWKDCECINACKRGLTLN